MEPIKFFQSIEHLEPHCKSCGAKVDYGVTTEWSDEKDTQICCGCGEEV